MTKQIHELNPDYEPDLATGIEFYKEGPSRDSVIAVIDSSISAGKSWDLELQLVTNLGKVFGYVQKEILNLETEYVKDFWHIPRY